MRKNIKRHNLTRLNSSVSNINYHIIWTTKYRKHLLTNEIQVELKKILIEKAYILNISIKAFELMDDHIHIFIHTGPNILVSKIVNMLKGFSSFRLRQSFPSLKKYKHLWTPSYFCESIGNISESSVIKYINNQKTIYSPVDYDINMFV